MKIEGKMRKSGSAIIIAFLLMAVVSGVAFSIAKLFYLDTALGGLYENSTVAYYAAESGIEEGLLRYRFDRNAEVAAVSTENDYINYDRVSRSNLVTGGWGLVNKSDEVSSQSNQIYDLNMFYKTKFYGTDVVVPFGTLDDKDLVDPKYGTEYSVPRDEAVKIDVTDALPNLNADLKLIVNPTYEPGSGMAEDQIFIEAKIIGTSGGKPNEYKKVLLADEITPSVSHGSWDADSYLVMNEIPGSGVYSVNNLVEQIASSRTYDVGTNISLYLKPVGCRMTVGIAPTGDYPITAPYSSIKSTGYYGGVGRTLTAKIDRQSGTVYDIFDFVVYQH